MTTQGFGHLYIETHNWGKAVGFWQRLGFEIEFDTGHGSGMLRHPAGGPTVFVAEQSLEDPLASEWYLAAGKGEGTPRNGPVPSCRTSDVRPCTGRGARPTRPPNAAASAWWPRQMPRSGRLPSAARATATEAPASRGPHGPGERTMRSRRSSARGVARSLRTTSTRAPRAERAWKRFQENESKLSTR